MAKDAAAAEANHKQGSLTNLAADLRHLPFFIAQTEQR